MEGRFKAIPVRERESEMYMCISRPRAPFRCLPAATSTPVTGERESRTHTEMRTCKIGKVGGGGGRKDDREILCGPKHPK